MQEVYSTISLLVWRKVIGLGVKVNSNPSPFNRKILVCPFELRNLIMGAAIPGGFKLRLFTEDLHISLILVLTNFTLAVTNNSSINRIKNTLNSLLIILMSLILFKVILESFVDDFCCC
ncbi:MAG: hypothetical protein RMY16_08100 [Nostoc sp. DedQUE12b]|nr:hypothetical protein [Nostoc sp. DedQUE12b]